MERPVSDLPLHMGVNKCRPSRTANLAATLAWDQRVGNSVPGIVSAQAPGPYCQVERYRMPPNQPRTLDESLLASVEDGCDGNIQRNQFSRPACEINVLWWPILKHANINTYRDTVCRYLQLTPEIWHALYMPRTPSMVQHHLSQHLSRLCGTLPTDLWECLVTLRNDDRFEQWQDHFVKTMRATASAKSHCPSPSNTSTSAYNAGAARGANRGPVRQPGLISPDCQSRFLTPGHAYGIQTPSTTPGSIVYRRSRRESQSPDRVPNVSAKGRAPAGYHYVCPYTNCTHRPFINAGNYINHMDRCHAEYAQHDPKDSLQPDSSPRRDTDIDWTSPTATDSGTLPLCSRNWFKEFGKGDGIFPPAGLELSLAGGGKSGPKHSSVLSYQLNPRPASASGGITSSSNMGTCPLTDSVPQPTPCWSGMNHDKVPEYGPSCDGGLSFGMFKASCVRAPSENWKAGAATLD